MPNYRRLLAAAVVAPMPEDWMQAQPWQAQVLGAGSIVELLKAEPSPITAKANELFVRWIDHAGREVKGWLAYATPINVGGRGLTFVGREDLKIGSWDELRERIFNSGLTAKQYIALNSTEQEQLTQLQAVIRELGGRIKNSDDDGTIITRAIRLTTGEDITMDDVQEERASAAPAAAKKSGKKGGKKGGGKKQAKGSVKVKRQPMSVTVGTSLLALGISGSAKQLATKLSKGEELKKKQLVELRDSINEAASKAREEKKGKVASQLSSANRLVRRLARGQ
jgi:hypothetical protein